MTTRHATAACTIGEGFAIVWHEDGADLIDVLNACADRARVEGEDLCAEHIAAAAKELDQRRADKREVED